MHHEPIKKCKTTEMSVEPNLLDYERARKAFKWGDIYKDLDGLDGSGMNIAYTERVARRTISCLTS
jgi:hypothetical protein